MESIGVRPSYDFLTMNLHFLKGRKLLITAGVYESEVAEKVQDTFEKYRETQSYKEAILSTANTLQLSKASVTSYLPYQKGVYFPSTADKEKISVGAERQPQISFDGRISRSEISTFNGFTWFKIK